VLEEFLGRDVVAPIYNKGWVDVMVDVDRDIGGKALNDRLKGKRSGGLPWSVILDADGKELVSSNAEPKGGNIGGPVTPEECAWFVEMLRRSCGEKVTTAELQVIAAELDAYSKPRRRRR
jgi:hypothetical protein